MRYFTDLTQSFLLPLERYLASLTPVHRCVSGLCPRRRQNAAQELKPKMRPLFLYTHTFRDISAWKMPPSVRPFKTEEFALVLKSNCM